MKTLKTIGIVILILEVFVGLDILLARSNPCSAWSASPGGCSSDHLQVLEK